MRGKYIHKLSDTDSCRIVGQNTNPKMWQVCLVNISETVIIKCANETLLTMFSADNSNSTVLEAIARIVF